VNGGASLPGVTAALEAGRQEGVAPAISAAVRHRGALVHHGCHGEVTGDPVAGPRPLAPLHLFDVASLTKVLATTTLCAQAVSEGALELDAPLCRWLPGFAAAGKGEVTVRQLLAHASGLPWWRPFHEATAAEPDPARRRAAVVEALLAEPLEAPPGTRCVYSDPGFMALGLGLEAALGGRLPALFEARVAAPLGLRDSFFVDALAPSPPGPGAGRVFAPTRREGARGLRLGTVDDDNAWAVGGAANKTETAGEENWTMNALTRWDPFKEMDDLQKRLTSIFGLAPARAADGKENMTVAQWLPLVDITEDDKEYLIKAELPEVKKDAVKVTVENGVLTISGERRFEKEEKDKKYHRIERAYGSFTRSFSVPDDADDAKVGAEFKDGVLTVRLAKSEKARPKSIEVKVS